MSSGLSSVLRCAYTGESGTGDAEELVMGEVSERKCMWMERGMYGEADCVGDESFEGDAHCGAGGLGD